MKSYISYLRQLASKHWQILSLFIAVYVGISAALLTRLATLLPGYSAQEFQAYHASDQLHTIWQQPFNAPFELLTRAIRYLKPHDLIAVRLTSVAIALIVIISFSIALTRWQGKRTALIGTALFGTSATFLHVGRLGSPDVMFLMLFPLALCGSWLRQKQARGAIIIAMLLVALLLYTPGMVWFILVGIILQWPRIDNAFKKKPGAVWFSTALFLVLLLPLGWHFYKNPHDLQLWIAMPQQWHLSALEHILRSIASVPLAIFIRQNDDNPVLGIGRLPLVNVFSTVMFTAGCYAYFKRAGLARVRFAVLMSTLAMIIIGLSQGRIPLTPLVPFMFVVVASGLGYLIDLWYSVFPRNPIAQGLGIGMVFLTLGLTISYDLQTYFVWPQATVTREVFTIQEP